jgi:DNA-directed RNA polymerase specialized sigma24 family protein
MTYESIQPTPMSIEVNLEHLTYTAYLFGLEEDLNNPILSLDTDSRTAFVLHHWLGYTIEEAAALEELSEEEFRADLRSAYLQLASHEVGADVHLSEMLVEPALA